MVKSVLTLLFCFFFFILVLLGVTLDPRVTRASFFLRSCVWYLRVLQSRCCAPFFFLFNHQQRLVRFCIAVGLTVAQRRKGNRKARRACCVVVLRLYRSRPPRLELHNSHGAQRSTQSNDTRSVKEEKKSTWKPTPVVLPLFNRTEQRFAGERCCIELCSQALR